MMNVVKAEVVAEVVVQCKENEHNPTRQRDGSRVYLKERE
jgi:hypothetical protein